MLAALLVAATVASQPVCGPADAVVATLAARLGQVEIWRGAGLVPLRLFAVPDGSHWTLAREADGSLCLLAAGDRWKLPGVAV